MRRSQVIVPVHLPRLCRYVCMGQDALPNEGEARYSAVNLCEPHSTLGWCRLFKQRIRAQLSVQVLLQRYWVVRRAPCICYKTTNNIKNQQATNNKQQ